MLLRMIAIAVALALTMGTAAAEVGRYQIERRPLPFAANATMVMDCEGFGRVARFVFGNGMITMEDFRNGENIGGPTRMNLIAFSKFDLRVLASYEDEVSNIAHGLLSVFELDFANPFARETRFNVGFNPELKWVYDKCRRLD